jgi:restriction endonuclease Mrr
MPDTFVQDLNEPASILLQTGRAIRFERLIVNLLLAMGYGGSVTDAGRALGASGDNGIDGVIDQDPLGLDRVYIQVRIQVETRHER